MEIGHKKAMRLFFKRNIVVMRQTATPAADATVALRSIGERQVGNASRASPATCIPTPSHIGEVQAQRAVAWLKEAGAIGTIKLSGKASGVLQPDSIRPAPAAWATIRRPPLSTPAARIHDVDNVFVIDGSVHVNNGGFNPALTIMAIAYMASASLVRNWKGTGLKS